MRALAVLAILTASGYAHASVPNCSVAPYGSSPSAYRIYQRTLELMAPAARIFPAICRAKFEHEGRAKLRHLLGVTDRQIDQMDVAELAARELQVIWRDKERPAGIYVPFTCDRVTGMCNSLPDTYVFQSRSACRQYVQDTGLEDRGQRIYIHCFFRASPWQP